MSEQETIVGKLLKVERLKNETDSDYFERVTKTTYAVKEYTPEDIQEAIYENCLSNDFICVNNCIYKIIEQKELCDTCFCEIKDNGDGTYDFYTSFYNSGTCLEEMLEEELERIENR